MESPVGGKLEIIPRPCGAGVASRRTCDTGLGVVVLEGSLLEGAGRDLLGRPAGDGALPRGNDDDVKLTR